MSFCEVAAVDGVPPHDGQASAEGAGRISRRTLLGAIAIAPTASAAGTLGRASTALPVAAAWAEAQLAYLAARRVHERFCTEILLPACRLAEAERGSNRGHLPAQHRILELEGQGDDLLVARHEALHRLIRVPVADIALVREKMQLAYDEIFQINDHHGLLAAILSDLHRMPV